MKKILLTLLSIITINAMAQDPQFSQYYQAPLYLNPGFTGSATGNRLVFNHRIQWPGLPQAFSTYAASYDMYADKLNSGFGLLVTTDKMGSAGWRSNGVTGLYSYKVKLTRSLIFSSGLSFGYGSNGLDRNKLNLGDGLEYEGQSLDPQLNNITSQHYFDFSSGFLFYNTSLWFGVSFHHMNRPNLSIINEESRLEMKTAIHGGLKIPLSSFSERTPYVVPSFTYRMQGSLFSQLDIGVNFHIDPVSIGAGYRGKPFGKRIDNAIANDAFIFLAGLHLDNLSLGYSYDFTLSKLNPSSGGAHEIAIAYEFASRKKNKKHHKLIPCPAFYNKADKPVKPMRKK